MQSDTIKTPLNPAKKAPTVLTPSISKLPSSKLTPYNRILASAKPIGTQLPINRFGSLASSVTGSVIDQQNKVRKTRKERQVVKKISERVAAPVKRPMTT